MTNKDTAMNEYEKVKAEANPYQNINGHHERNCFNRGFDSGYNHAKEEMSKRNCLGCKYLSEKNTGCHRIGSSIFIITDTDLKPDSFSCKAWEAKDSTDEKK